MAKAKDEVRARYPDAMVVRATFGLVVVVEDGSRHLGDGRNYWEEEAWIEAAESLGR